jgi:hypothetical protein
MADKADILVDNLKGALQQTQRYIFAGALSAALFLLVDKDAPELIRSGDRADVPYLGKVPPGIAAIALYFAYIAFSLLAALAIRRIRKIVAEIRNKEIVGAVLTQFSVLTLESRPLRIMIVLIAPVLMLVSLFIELAGGARPSLGAIIIGVPLLIFSPYLFLLYQVVKPIK